ncbi:hypothetical protein ACFV0L_33525 [Streptosporangium canum]|uniref:hypothetical protein n=1 Tax=Streptosporangium canum TaxID=324952 RepID=UPI0036D04FF1
MRRRVYATSWSLVMRLAPVPPTALRIAATAAVRSAPGSSEMQARRTRPSRAQAAVAVHL